ncbi:MAG: two-component regulator propeller domain-containing protein, partial [Rikenellaceae bacterium]
MRSFKLLILLVVLLFTNYQNAFPGEQSLSEQQNINISSGLSHNVITKIFCDSRGIMWFGTYDGLNMYNGVSTYTYKDTYDYINLPSNRIRDIIEDTDTRLWIATEQGVEVYDYNCDKFFILPVEDIEMVGYNLVILKIIPSKDGQKYYCVTDNNGIITYDSDLRFVCQTPFPSQITDALDLSGDVILISSTIGFYLYDITHDSVESVDIGADVKFDQAPPPIRFANYNDSTILIGLNNRCIPINYIESEKGYIFTSKAPRNFDFGIRDIVVDDKGAIWFASERDGFFYMPSISSRSSEIKNYLSNHQIAEIM